MVASGKPFDAMLADVSNDKLHPEIRKDLQRLGKMLDKLAVLDTTSQEVFVDKAAFRAMVKAFMSPDVADTMVASLGKLPDSKLRGRVTKAERAAGHMQIIEWSTLRNHVEALSQKPHVTLESMGLDLTSTQEDVEKAMQIHFPDMPADLFEPERLHKSIQTFTSVSPPGETVQKGIAQDEIGTRGVLDDIWWCLVGNLGWWGAVFAATAVIVVSIAFSVAMTASGGVIGVVFWAAFWPALAVWGAIGVVFDVIVIIVFCLIGRR